MAMRIDTNAPKPYTVLTKVRSETGSWEYEIRTSHKTGLTYCTCKKWQFTKTCKHLDAYNANPIIAAPSIATLPIRKTKTPGDVLREELAALGYSISTASANAISTRVLSAGGKMAASGNAAPEDALNADSVRVIILPD